MEKMRGQGMSGKAHAAVAIQVRPADSFRQGKRRLAVRMTDSRNVCRALVLPYLPSTDHAERMGPKFLHLHFT